MMKLSPPAGGVKKKRTIGLPEWSSRLDSAAVSKADLHRLVMNYLVTEGYMDVAEAFEREAGVPMEGPQDMLRERMEIRKAIHAV
jgi:glucose-induced degradation protein 8